VKLAHRLRVVVFALAAMTVAGLMLSLPTAQAQAPTISSLSPLSLRPGQSQDVVVRGGSLAGATHFWTSFPARAVLTPLKPNNGKNPGEVSFRVTVPPETPPGTYGVRVATNQGISPLRILLVDDLSAVAQQAGNTTPAAAQHVSLPAAIDGTVDALASQFYKFHVEAGQRLSLEIFARRIGSALDPTLRLFDSVGREIAYSDDLPGLSEDADINHTFAKAGDYVLCVEDNLNQGGGNYPYHLRIGDFPGAAVALPLGATRGSEVVFRFADKSGAEIEPLHVKVPADPLLFALNVPARFVGGSSRGFATVLLSDRPEFNETEPNDDRKAANRVEFGDNLNGRLQQPGDVDHFIFRAKSSQSVRFTAFARRLGSPADIVLRLTKPDGSQLSYAEGAAANEATFSMSFPADGEYVLEVADLNRRGGPRFAYHVDVTPSDAGFSLAASADSLNIPAGGTAIVTVTAVRSRYVGPIAVQAVGLPAGVTSVPTVIGPGQDNVVLTLRSAAGVPTGHVYPVRIVGSARVRNAEFHTSAAVVDALKTDFGGMPYPPESLMTATALGIGAPAPFALHTEPAELVFGRNLSATVKVIAERQKGFDEEISLEAVSPETEPKQPPPPKHPLPAGITAALKPIPKGASSVEITFAADNQVALAEFTAVLAGTLKKANQALTQPAPGIALKLEEPFHLSVAAESAKLPRKGKLKLKVTARRNPAFKGEIVLACSQLPKGIVAAPAKFAPGATEQELVLSATPDASPGAIKNVKIQGQAKVGSGRFSSKIPLPGIAVE
jgi:hypothetical protein